MAGLLHVVVMLGEAVDLQAGEGVGRPWCLANLNGEEAALGFCSKRTVQKARWPHGPSVGHGRVTKKRKQEWAHREEKKVKKIEENKTRKGRNLTSRF